MRSFWGYRRRALRYGGQDGDQAAFSSLDKSNIPDVLAKV